MHLQGRRVLLVGAEHVQGLVAARSLGRAGAEVHLAASEPTANRLSRFVTAAYVHPDPLHDRVRFVAWVAGMAAAHDLDVVLPIDDATTFAVVEAAGELPASTVLAAPSAGHVRLSFDKEKLATVAAEAGVQMPVGASVNDADDAAEFARTEGPVVVKSRVALTVEDGRVVEGGRVCRCWTPSEARVAAATIIAAEGEALVQRLVGGVEFGVGAVRAATGECPVLVQQRIRSWPPTGGPPALVRTAAPDPAIVEAVRRLLDVLDWTGAAQADVMVDGDRAVLLDLNARLWFSVGLAVRAGVDFPVMAASAALGLPIPADVPYPVGEGWGYLDAELRHAFCVVANRRNVRVDGEGTVAALRRWRAELAGPVGFDPLDRADPRPAAGRLLWELPRTLVRHRRERAARGG